jgi:hypothetical protein
MSLAQAHEGYEYQDLLTSYFILQQLLLSEQSLIVVDKKDHKGDKFDDITIHSSERTFRKQVKFSGTDANKKLSKGDLASSSGYDIAIFDLFLSWQRYQPQPMDELRLCLRWADPEDDDILDVLEEIGGADLSVRGSESRIYRINIRELWPVGEKPPKTWKAFNKEIITRKISRDEFSRFCDDFVIETGLPSFSMDLYHPGALETMFLSQIDQLGIGDYPNNKIEKESFAFRILELVKQKRASDDNGEIRVSELLSMFGIRTDYGGIKQVFPVSSSHLVSEAEQTPEIVDQVLEKRRSIIQAEPGAGKSWFSRIFEDVAVANGVTVIRHYCYTEIEDIHAKERIKRNTVYGNLIAEILSAFPHLIDVKESLYSSTLSELNILLECIDEPTIIIIDGLDHIERVYKLQGHEMSREEINIIGDIGQLRLGEHVSCLVLSQPISELKQLEEWNYIELPVWTLARIEELMNRHSCENDLLSSGETLSQVIQNKGEDNALFMRCIMEEVHKGGGDPEAIISELPEYSYNLAKYYAYLLEQLDNASSTASALAACHFRLSGQDLQNITGFGKDVERQLEALKPIINSNAQSGGHIIYHESFRRYMHEAVENQGGSVSVAIYRPVITWLANQGFYDNAKSYRFLNELLILTKDYSGCASRIEPEFLINSVYAGHPLQAIKRNYGCFLRAVSELKDGPKLILVIEFSRIISGVLEANEETFPSYFAAFLEVFGHESAVRLISYDNAPQLPLEDGITSCYLCSRMGQSPPWDLYLRLPVDNERFSLDELKYFVRSFLDNGALDTLFQLIRNEKTLGLAEGLAAIREEVLWDINELNRQGLWQLFIEIGGQDTQANEEDDALEIAKLILREESTWNAKPLILSFQEAINKLVNTQAHDELTVIKSLFFNRNWYNNWLVFCVELAELKAEENPENSAFEDCFLWLTKDVDQFKGEPRLSDLYDLHGLIQQSVREYLGLLKGKELWSFVIPKLRALSDATTTYLTRTENGPLDSIMISQLVVEHLNDDNSAAIGALLDEWRDVDEQSGLHPDISKKLFNYAKVLHRLKQGDLAQSVFRRAVQFMLAYEPHKDSMLDEVLLGIEGVNALDKDLAQNEHKDLLEFAWAVQFHTNQKNVSHYPVTWFKKQCLIEPKTAALYLMNWSLNIDYNTRGEDSIWCLAREIKERHPILAYFLVASIPLQSYEERIRLKLECIDAAADSYIDLPFKDQEHSIIGEYIESAKVDHFSNDFSSAVLDFLPIRYRKDCIGKTRALRPNEQANWGGPDLNIAKRIEKAFPARIDFNEMSEQAFAAYIDRYGFQEKDAMSLKFLFLERQTLSPIHRNVIWAQVDKEFHMMRRGERDIGEYLFSGTSESARLYWSRRFIAESGSWFEVLVNQEAFSNAIDIDKEKTVSDLFEAMPDLLQVPAKPHNMAGNLINAFAKNNIDKKQTLEMWYNLKAITSLRLPSLSDSTWDEDTLNEFDLNEEEAVIAIILCRFKVGTVERAYRNLSTINHLIEHFPTSVIKPLKWFLKSWNKFTTINVYLVLELLHNSQINCDSLRDEIAGMYPTRMFMVDFLIEKMFSDLAHDKILIEKRLRSTVGENQLKAIIVHNHRNWTLYEYGLDMNSVSFEFIQLRESGGDDAISRFWDPSRKIRVEDTVIPEYMFKSVNTALNSTFDQKPKPYKLRLYDQIKPELSVILSLGKSRTYRPDLVVPSQLIKEPESHRQVRGENGWVRVGYSEIQRISAGYGEEDKLINLFVGASFAKNEAESPVGGVYAVGKAIYEYLEPRGEQSNFCTIRNKGNDSLEEPALVWLTPEFITRLHLIVPKPGEKLIATDRNGNAALRMENWRSKYSDYEFRHGLYDEIPRLEGVELLLREDLFEEVCTWFDNRPQYRMLHNFNGMPFQ